MVREEQWAFIFIMAAFYFCLKQRCNLVSACLLIWTQVEGMDVHMGCAETRPGPRRFFLYT